MHKIKYMQNTKYFYAHTESHSPEFDYNYTLQLFLFEKQMPRMVIADTRMGFSATKLAGQKWQLTCSCLTSSEVVFSLWQLLVISSWWCVWRSYNKVCKVADA